MKTRNYLLLTLAAAFMMLGCEKEELYNSRTITGIGDQVTRSLDLDPINSITLDGVANIYVVKGTDQSVTLRAQQNIIDVMNWELRSGNLIISLDENISLRNHKEIRFEITVNELNKLSHSGVGDVYLEGATASYLEIDFRGVGDIQAYDMPVGNCDVYSDGVGDCWVMVNDYLDVDIPGLGNVYFRGNPGISFSSTGPGNLINDN